MYVVGVQMISVSIVSTSEYNTDTIKQRVKNTEYLLPCLAENSGADTRTVWSLHQIHNTEESKKEKVQLHACTTTNKHNIEYDGRVQTAPNDDPKQEEVSL